MNLEKNVLLKNYSTFKIGGLAKYFFDCKKIDELKEVLNWAKKKKEKFFILGGGSNILFSSEGFIGIVIRIKNEKIKFKSQGERVIVSCGSGAVLAKLISFSVKNNLTGLEWAVGIPGTVGGAIRGNAGAFGGEISDNVILVKALQINDEIKIEEFSNDKCRFGYRNSFFKENKNLVIWEVEFELKKKQQEETRKKIREILRKRKAKQPLEYPSAGSIFKNPVVSRKIIKDFEKDKEVKCKNNKVPAGWLIESCGLKGKRIGGAKISEKQANFIINLGSASAEDVMILISLIKQKVRNKFNIQLQEEIEIVV